MASQETFGRIGPYSLLATVAEGGMARVFLAKPESSRRLCVLKQLHHELEEHATARLRFRREATIAAKITHPNVVQLLDAGFHHDRFYIVSEFVAGQTVEQLVEAGPIPPRIAIAIVAGVLEGLAAVHGAVGDDGQRLSIVHRDISPRNIMVSFAGEVKLIDFGIAHAGIDRFRTSPGMVLGSLGYMPPEQALSLGVDDRTDLYSAGVVLYELLTGRTVVLSNDLTDSIRRIAYEVPAPIRSFDPALPERLEAAVMKAMAKRPADRFQSASEFRSELIAACPEPATEHELSLLIRARFAKQEEEIRWLMHAVADDPAPSLPDVDEPSWSLEATEIADDAFEDPTEVGAPAPRTPPPFAIQNPQVIAESIRALSPNRELFFSFAEISLDEILLLLHESRFTGALDLGEPPHHDKVIFRNGTILGTGHAPLLDANLLRIALLDRVDRIVLETLPLGIKNPDPDLLANYLLKRGLIDLRQLARARSEQSLHRVFALFNRRDRVGRIREGMMQLIDFVPRNVDIRPVVAYGVIICSHDHRRATLAARLRYKFIRAVAAYDERRNAYGLSRRILEAIRPLADGLQMGERPRLENLDDDTALGVLLLLDRIGLLAIEEPKASAPTDRWTPVHRVDPLA